MGVTLRNMTYESVDKLQNILVNKVFHYAKDRQRIVRDPSIMASLDMKE